MKPKSFYIGVKALIVRDRRVLLLKSHKINGISYWDFPGGRINGGETTEVALTREIQEELLGVTDVQIGELVATHRLSVDLPDGHGLMLIFFQVDAVLPDVLVMPDHADCRWLTEDELTQLPDRPELRFEPGYRAAALLVLRGES